MTPRQRRAFACGIVWPGFGQLQVGRTRAGICLAMGGLGLADVAFCGWTDPSYVLAPWAVPAAVGWLLLWAGGLGDLFNLLVLGPSQRERSARLLRSGMAYLLRGDHERAEAALSRAVALKGEPCAALYLAEAERRLGRGGRAARRLQALAASPRGTGWQWEIRQALSQGGST
jgi:hypothetical protein